MGVLLVLLAAALTPTVLAEDGEYSLPVEYGKQRSVDGVLAKVVAANDNWVGEQDFESIDKHLKSIAAEMIDDPGSFEPLAELAGAYKGLSLAEFKILAITRDSELANHVRLTARAEIGGESQQGGLLSTLGYMDMLWRSDPEGWTLREAESREFRERRREAFGFRDVSDEVFGAIDSYREQLSHGADHWRNSMDAALGVSVYGHHGVSLGDFDGDGLEDLYVSQPAGLPNRLYRNNGDGTFSDVTRKAGLDVLDETSMSLFADFDNDGDQDIVLIAAKPILYRNDGSGVFSLDTRSGLGVPPEKAAMFTGAAVADYDLDGDLDLYVCAYDFWEPGADYDAPTPFYDAVNGPPNLLFRNDGPAGFTEVASEAGMAESNVRFSFTASWGDYDDDGDPDLYVANDFGRNNLYQNNGDGTFRDVAAALDVEDLGAGMSVGWGDYDNDGDLDLYTANIWSSAGMRITGSSQFESVAPQPRERRAFSRQAQGNTLFRNDGSGGFRDVSVEAGTRVGRWSWASDFVDVDNDGLLDLFVLNGYITGERLDDL